MNWIIKSLGGYTKKQVAAKIAEAEKVQLKYWENLAFEVETDNMEKRLQSADMHCTIFLRLAKRAKEQSNKSSHLFRYAEIEKGRVLALEIDIKLRRNK